MLGIYFSGTGNSKYVAELFCNEYDKDSKVLSIEDENVINEIKNNDFLIISYPVQYSTAPKILRDFIFDNSDLWKNKKVFVIATMGLFSGDGSGYLARILRSYKAEIVGGLHLKMPDSIADEKVLKRSFKKNKLLIEEAEQKIKILQAAPDGSMTAQDFVGGVSTRRPASTFMGVTHARAS